MIIAKVTRDGLLKIAKEKKIYLEGNLLKLIEADRDDKEFEEYLSFCKEKDTSTRKKRLEITKQIQSQNKELIIAQEANMKLMEDLKVALEASTNAKEAAEADLDLLQKKTQTELIGTIVKVALWIIVGIGVITTLLYGMALVMGVNTTLLGNAWSNMFGILLTNSFSIIGTIMGVKYASEHK